MKSGEEVSSYEVRRQSQTLCKYSPSLSGSKITFAPSVLIHNSFHGIAYLKASLLATHGPAEASAGGRRAKVSLPGGILFHGSLHCTLNSSFTTLPSCLQLLCSKRLERPFRPSGGKQVLFEGRQGFADDRRRSSPLTNIGFLMNCHVCRDSDLMQTNIIPKETLD